MTLRDDTEHEKSAALPYTSRYALRTTTSTGSHPDRRSSPL
jgi:hypothetical protein